MLWVIVVYVVMKLIILNFIILSVVKLISLFNLSKDGRPDLR